MEGAPDVHEVRSSLSEGIFSHQGGLSACLRADPDASWIHAERNLTGLFRAKWSPASLTTLPHSSRLHQSLDTLG